LKTKTIIVTDHNYTHIHLTMTTLTSTCKAVTKILHVDQHSIQRCVHDEVRIQIHLYLYLYYFVIKSHSLCVFLWF